MLGGGAADGGGGDVRGGVTRRDDAPAPLPGSDLTVNEYCANPRRLGYLTRHLPAYRSLETVLRNRSAAQRVAEAKKAEAKSSHPLPSTFRGPGVWAQLRKLAKQRDPRPCHSQSCQDDTMQYFWPPRLGSPPACSHGACDAPSAR